MNGDETIAKVERRKSLYFRFVSAVRKNRFSIMLQDHDYDCSKAVRLLEGEWMNDTTAEIKPVCTAGRNQRSAGNWLLASSIGRK